MKAYILKYWATQGIFSMNGEKTANGRFMAEYPRGLYGSFAASEWAATVDEAIQKAEKLRKKKLASLRKQIDELMAKKIRVY